jgi:hypothetical protein
VETVSTRTCQLRGCEVDLDAAGLKATAKFCTPQHRREHNRQQGDGDPDRVWVRGHWKQRPAKRSQARRATRKPDPALTMICAALLIRSAAEASTEVRR